MTKIRKLTALTRAGIIESLQFRLGPAVMLFGNLIYLALVYFLWKVNIRMRFPWLSLFLLSKNMHVWETKKKKKIINPFKVTGRY